MTEQIDLDALEALAKAARERGYGDVPRVSSLIGALESTLTELRQERERADDLYAANAGLVDAVYATDAALSRAEETIEAVKALHFEHENTIHTTPVTVCAHRYCVDGMGDQVAWPCPTGRILTEYDKQKGRA